MSAVLRPVEALARPAAAAVPGLGRGSLARPVPDADARLRCAGGRVAGGTATAASATHSQFFFYDTPKVLLLLTGIVFVMGMVNSYFTPERTRALLAGRSEGAANVMAASLGIVTPFCSCSAVPLFIGFVQAGVPLGVTFSFLISAPMVNEVALALLFGMFGWKSRCSTWAWACRWPSSPAGSSAG